MENEFLKDGKIIAQEERFTRKKHESYNHAIEFVLKYANKIK